MLLMIVINKIQDSCVHLLLINRLANRSPKNVIFLKNFDSEFSYICVWLTDQNCKSVQIEDKVNITLVINESVKYKNNKTFSST